MGHSLAYRAIVLLLISRPRGFHLSKSRAGFWLLISLLPSGLATFIMFIIYLVSFETTADGLSASSSVIFMLFLLFLLYWWGALISGIVLKILGKRQSGQTFRNAQRYAEMNGWHPISQTAWRSMKANGASLAVNQAFEKSTYILTIEASAGTTTVPDFANPLWALQFGDWLWEKTGGDNITPATASAQRQAWSQSLTVMPHI